MASSRFPRKNRGAIGLHHLRGDSSYSGFDFKIVAHLQRNIRLRVDFKRFVPQKEYAGLPHR
jgi:hypothetical protein